MRITFSYASGTLKRFRRKKWKFQVTFRTPPDKARRFVLAVTQGLSPLPSGRMTIDEVVFEPNRISSLLTNNGVSLLARSNTHYMLDWTIEAVGADLVRELLESALADAIDFLFVPASQQIALYADHDDYTTLFANSRSKADNTLKALMQAGYSPISDFFREF